jgi:hypothetical protein
MSPLVLHSSPRLPPGVRRRELHVEYAASLDAEGGLRLHLT